MHHYLCVVNESGDFVVDQIPEGSCQSVEIGSDFCGPSEEIDYPTTAGKPWSIQPFLVVYKCYYNPSPIICALSDIGIGCIPIVA